MILVEAGAEAELRAAEAAADDRGRAVAARGEARGERDARRVEPVRAARGVGAVGELARPRGIFPPASSISASIPARAMPVSTEQ